MGKELMCLGYEGTTGCTGRGSPPWTPLIKGLK